MNVLSRRGIIRCALCNAQHDRPLESNAHPILYIACRHPSLTIVDCSRLEPKGNILGSGPIHSTRWPCRDERRLTSKALADRLDDGVIFDVVGVVDLQLRRDAGERPLQSLLGRGVDHLGLQGRASQLSGSRGVRASLRTWTPASSGDQAMKAILFLPSGQPTPPWPRQGGGIPHTVSGRQAVFKVVHGVPRPLAHGALPSCLSAAWAK